MRATRKLAGFLGPYWHWAILAPLLMAVEVVMDLLQPRMIQRIVDDGIARSDAAVVVHTGLLMIGSLIMAVLTSPRLDLVFIPLIPVVAVALIWIINYGRLDASDEEVVAAERRETSTDDKIEGIDPYTSALAAA